MTDWSDILEEHGRIVWQTAYRLVNNHADAADCFQDTFISAVEFSRRHHVDSWPALLKRLATTRALDQLRARARSSFPRASISHPHQIIDEHKQPSEDAEDDELLERLREALAQLPLRQAEACSLRLLEEMSYDEIAKILNVKVSHVGVLLNRAKTALRQQLIEFAPATSSGHNREV